MNIRGRSLCLLTLMVTSAVACSSPNEENRLPNELPFTLVREPVGQPPNMDEISAFTKKITTFWRQVDYFRWCSWHSHGLHSSYDPDMPDYALWWKDTVAIKTGDTVTFQHVDVKNDDNLMIRTNKVLSNAIPGYLASGDPIMRQLIIDYCKGTVALFQGLVYRGEDPVEPYVASRAIFTHNHDYTTPDGRKVVVDYSPVREDEHNWNAHTVFVPDNPFFGSIWVRNMRSKDDLPHMWRVVPWLMWLVEDTEDEEVRAAAREALEYLTGMARDIVDHDYLIRTKEADQTFVPTEEDNPDVVKDLASFVAYEDLVPNAECNPKLTAALLAYGEDLGNDCGNGMSSIYETVSTTMHYYNFAIVRYFHLTAITSALILGKDRIAEHLLRGLVDRVDSMLGNEDQRTDPRWSADAATFLLASASSGLPLTAQEAKMVQEQFGAAVDHYQEWPHWDLWDESHPDGEYPVLPPREGSNTVYLQPEEMACLIEYCFSHWKNPVSVELVDCEIVLDPSRWGE